MRHTDNILPFSLLKVESEPADHFLGECRISERLFFTDMMCNSHTKFFELI